MTANKAIRAMMAPIIGIVLAAAPWILLADNRIDLGEVGGWVLNILCLPGLVVAIASSGVHGGSEITIIIVHSIAYAFGSYHILSEHVRSKHLASK